MTFARPPLAPSRAALLAGLLLAAAGAARAVTQDAAEARRPNVLFIISDDLSAEALGCYGNVDCETPHIDALARRATRFTRAFCQYPVCGPSRAALMSGMYAQAIGVTGNGKSSKFTKNLGDRPSMSQHFMQHGYYAARVSKIYHMLIPGNLTDGVSGPDHAASWAEAFNCPGPEWMTEGEHEHLSNEKLKFERDKHYNLGFGTAFYVVRGQSDGAEQPDVQAADKAIELLEAHRDEPFFLAVGMVRPHVPLVAPAPYFTPYPPADMQLAESVQDDWADIPKAGISKNSAGSGLEDPADQRAVLAAYYATVSFMDAQVGRILAALDRLGLRDDTVVVFTSDHGYHLGEHEFWQKMSLHEESTRIPVILSVPGNPPAVTDALAQQIDFYPTFAELAGLSVPEHCQGRSLKPVLDDPTAEVHESVYCLRSGGHMLRTDGWAYLLYPDGSAELYDMEQDPRQFSNLAEHPAHAEQRTRMQTLLDAKLESMGV